MKNNSFSREIVNIFFCLLLIAGIAACTSISPEKESEKDMYDNPDEAALFQKMRTQDPRTGEVPSDKMWAAITETKIQKEALLNSSSLISALAWEERGSNADAIGPSNGNTRANNAVTSGRIDALWVDLADVTGKTVWVGGRGGGIWKTTDITVAPATWIPVNDYMINLSIAAITQDPTNTDIMYLCTGESFYESGALRGNGVFKSTDHGVNWSQLPSTNNSDYYYCTRILCDNQGNIYVGTRSGLFRSTKASGGNSWTTISPSGVSSQISDLEISTTGRLHVICGLSGTLSSRYTDNPLTVASGSWTSPVTPLPSNNRRGEIAVSGNVLYCLPGNNANPSQAPTVYKSTDAGANWATAGSTPLTASGGPFANGQGWYNLTVAINPADPNECIVGGIDNAKTTNGGTSWTRISNWVGTTGQYAHADQHGSIWYDNGNKLILGNDGGIFYSADGGVTIRDRNVGLRLKQFYSVAVHPSTTNYYLTGAQDNGTHQFYNAGLSSSVEAFGGDGAYVAIDQDQPQFQIGSYVYSNYRRSTNSGTNWLFGGSDNNGLFINPFDYDDAADRVYASYTAGNYLRWSDPQSGFTYTPVPVTAFGGQQVGAVFASPFTANQVFFGMASGGKIIRVDNADGASPTGVDLTDAAMPTGAVFMNCINAGSSGQNLVATYSNYGTDNIWVTTNGGTSWVNIDGNLPDMPVYWATFHPDNNSKMFIATETGVWETDLINGSSTVWTANTSFPTARATMLQYRSSDRTLAASTYGRGLWTSLIPAVTTPDVQFQTAFGNATESTAATSVCRGYTDYINNLVILNPPTGSGSATATLTIAGGGTALPGVDFDITTNGSFVSPSMQLSFPVGSNPPQPFTIRVYDDAAVEAAENFTLNFSLNAGSTNAQPGSSNQSFVFTINDNDVGPTSSSSNTQQIGASSYNIGATLFNSSIQSKRCQILYKASELTSAGFVAGPLTGISFFIGVKNSVRAFTNLSLKMGGTTLANLVDGGVNVVSVSTVKNAFTHNTVAGFNDFIFDIPFVWNGTDNVVVELCYDNGSADAGETPDNTYAYSDCGGSCGTTGNMFWQDGINCSGSFSSVTLYYDNIKPRIKLVQSVAGTAISTALVSSKTAYLGPNDDVYFYDGSGSVLARIKNLTAFDYGCTQVEIDRAGSSTAAFWNATPANYLASKSIKVIPTNNTTSGSYELTMYYTTAEVSGFNAAAAPATFATSQLVKVSNGFFIPDVSPGSPHFADAYVKTAATAAFGATGNTITATFSNTGFSGFGVGTPGNSLLTADYRSKGTGNYSDGTKWEYNIFGANYIDANQSPTSGSNVTIQPVHTITLNAAQTIGSGKILVVAGTLNAGTNTISGAGGFTLAAGGTFATANTGTNGITQNITVSGSKTFTNGANYIFNGASTVPFGSLFTTVRPNNVVAGANVTLDKPVYITGALGFSGSNRMLTTGGNLTIGSSLSGTARVADITKDFISATAVSGNSISGTATVERYIATTGAGVSGRKWRLLSGIGTTTAQTIRDSWQEGGAAVNNQGTWITKPGGGNGFDGTSVSSSILYHLQGGAGGPSWNAVAASNTGSLNDRQGYMLFVRGDRNATAGNTLNAATVLRTNGTLKQGSQSAVVVSAIGPGRTLVGNPFASPIDVDPIFLNHASLDQAMYIWDHTLTGNYGVGGYRLVERNGGAYQQTPVVLGGGATPDANSRYIHSGQAFFLKAGGPDANVLITENMKSANQSVVNPIVNTAGDQQLFVNLKSVHAGNTESLTDGIRVRFDAAYSAGLADDYEKMGNFGENISSYRADKKLIVEKRPMISNRDTIFLKLTNLEIKDYRFETGTFDFVQANVTAFLEDSWLNTSTLLALDGTLTNIDFSVSTDPASANPDRFRIVFAAAGPLPVSFTSVGAVANGNGVEVTWMVSNQINLLHYVVERSSDGITFNAVNTQPVSGANGSDASYAWIDNNPATGDNYYRIRSVDNGGSNKLSLVVMVNLKLRPDISIYPNPVVGRMVRLQFLNMDKGRYQLRLYNVQGQVVLQRSVNHTGGNAALQVALGNGLSAGKYRLEFIRPNGEVLVKSLLVSE